MGLTIDDVMEEIGSFGRYQLRLLVVMGLMMYMNSIQVVISTFLSPEPPWRCRENSTVCNLIGNFKPGDTDYDFRCKIPREDWEFDTREFNSIVSEWDLVCDVSALSNLTKSLLFVGVLFGVLIGGLLSDKTGRRLLVYIPHLMGMLCALAASFTHAYWLYALLRVVVGICEGCSVICSFVLITEYVGKGHRHVAGTCLWFFWVFALMSVALLAYLIRDWRTLSIVGSAPGLLQVVFWWFLPESSRWLLVHNKNQQVVDQLTKVAEFNRREMPKEEIELKVEATRHGDFREMFSSAKMTRITLISWFSWVVVAMVYYGVTFSSGEFGGNRYLVFFLTSIVEIPSNITAIVAMKRIGRKKTVVVGFVLSTVAALIAVFLQRNMSDKGFLVGRIIMAQVIAKFFINMSFDAVYIYAAELFPTVIRNLGVGSSSAFARIGSMSAPYIVWLVRVHVLLPYSIMVAFTFLASVLCFFLLPETKDAPTPETMDAVNSSSGADMTQNGDLYSGEVCQEKEELGELLLLGYWT